MTIKKGRSKIGHSGMNNLKNCTLCVKRPIKKIDKPKLSDKYKVIVI